MYLLISSLFIDSEWPPLVRFFGPMRHYFNPLKDIDYKKARQLSEIFIRLRRRRDDALTACNGKRALLKALLEAEQLGA